MARAVRTSPLRDTTPVSQLRGSSSLSTRIVPIVRQGGFQSVAAGGSFDEAVEGALKVVELHLDIPDDVTADLEVDGVIVASVSDGAGLVGSLRCGDYSLGAYMAAGKLRLYGTNDAAAAQDVRAWAVVL